MLEPRNSGQPWKVPTGRLELLLQLRCCIQIDSIGYVRIGTYKQNKVIYFLPSVFLSSVERKWDFGLFWLVIVTVTCILLWHASDHILEQNYISDFIFSINYLSDEKYLFK